MSRYYLGIDTSNYTTSVAVCDECGNIIVSEKKLLEVAEGQRGLRQSDAVFAHIKNLPQLFSSFKGFKYTAVGVSKTPRDNIGSYMPCFEAGYASATAVASSMNLPLYIFSHQRGHIRAALHSAGREELIGKEYLAFHVSGGTTELLHVKNGEIVLEGGTDDLNAGQCIDRAGVLMGLKFPCGKALEELAKNVGHQKVKVCVKDTHCNLSGVENQVKKMLENGTDTSVIAAYVLDFTAETVYRLSVNAREKFGSLPIVYAGGVMSDRRIAHYLSELSDVSFAAPDYSCDNAMGCALLTKDSHEKTLRDSIL